MTYAVDSRQPRAPLSRVTILHTAMDSSSNKARPCRLLRPRGRQRSLLINNHSWILLSLLTIFQLSTLTPGIVSGQSTPSPVSGLVKDNAGAATPSWQRRRMGGLSETVTNTEQELINKILRDDTSSAPTSSFQYTRLPSPAVAPPAVVTALPSAADSSTTVGVTKSDTDRVPGQGSPPPLSTSGSHSNGGGGGKINQSRSKQEQEAFNERSLSSSITVTTSQKVEEDDHQLGRTRPSRSSRRRRAVNVVVNTFSREEEEEEDVEVFVEQEPQSLIVNGQPSSVNSNFLLKSIVTQVQNCLSGKCPRDKFRSLSTSDIPQLLHTPANNSSGSVAGQDYSTVNVLNLSDSGLRALPHRTMTAIAEKLPHVQFIDLSVNQLKAANLVLSGSLAFLNFSQNQLTRFQLRNGTLAYLDLSHNSLGQEDNNETAAQPPSILLDERCANLTMLDLSHNHLNDLTFLRPSSSSSASSPTTTATCPLRVLNLAHNRLRRIKWDSFASVPHLEILSVAHNLVAEIENDTFAHLQHLQYLDLSGNRLNASSVRALQGIPDLIGLSLAHNPQLGDALQGFVASWSLKELDISGTGLCDVPAALAQSVRTLKLAHNYFQVIRSGDLDSYPLLFNLDLGHCGIAEIEDDALGRLEMLATLNLNHNELRQVPVSLPENLMALHLEDNHIMELQANRFAHLANLKVLSLSGNKIQYLPALPLRKLLVLNLVSAELHGLSQLVVQTSPHLKDLRLDNNPVKCADLLGIAEWATPCRDVGGMTVKTSSGRGDGDYYHDLDDDELQELAEENDRNNLQYLLDYVASKDRPRQLSTSSDKAHLCRSSPTTITTDTVVHLNATKGTEGRTLPPLQAATLVSNKSTTVPGTDVGGGRGEADTGETEQISSNLPNPPVHQTVTTTIIKTLPSSPLLALVSSTTVLPPLLGTTPSVLKSGVSPVETNKTQEANVPMMQNKGSLQITGHLNNNIKSDRAHSDDDDATATNVNERAAARDNTNDNEIFPATTTHSPSLGPLSAQLGAQNETSRGRKSSESVAIKLEYNKNASTDEKPVLVPTADVRDSTGHDDDGGVDKKNKKPLDRVNNKKLIKLTDSSNSRKLMPFIGETGQQRRRISGGPKSVFAQQSILSHTPTPPPLLLLSSLSTSIGDVAGAMTTPDNGDSREATIQPLTSPTSTPTTSTRASHVTSSPADITSTTNTSPQAPFQSMPALITLSPAAVTKTVDEQKTLPISSKQIIFQRLPQITPTRDEVHNSLNPSSSGKVFATTTTSSVATTTAPSAGKVVNETEDGTRKENLPKTGASSSAKTTAKERTPSPVIWRNDDDNATATVPDSTGKQVANGKLMRKKVAVVAQQPKTSSSVSLAQQPTTTKGLIEDTASTEDDNDNPLLKLWQQASTHLSSHTTIPPPPEANPDGLSVSQSNTSGAGGSGDDVNERKNLIRTKSDGNKKPTITRSTPASLKSETILINDRNNDAQDDNSAAGAEAAWQVRGRVGMEQTETEEDATEEDVLKLSSRHPHHGALAKESGEIYVAENSLSVAELVVLAPSKSSPQTSSGDITANRGRPDKLSQLNTNAIHVAEGEALTAGAGVLSRAPWNEHIKDDGGRSKDTTENGDGDGTDDGIEAGDSDNYHHRQPHPGLFIVIGASIGIVLSIGLFRCKQSWTHRHYPLPDTGDINQTYTHSQPQQPPPLRRQFDYHQQRMATRPSSSSSSAVDNDSYEGGRGDAFLSSSPADEFGAQRQQQQRFAGSEDDYYRCTNWRDRVPVSDKDNHQLCDGAHFVDVQLTPRAERKSVKFDLLPMKILSPNDHQPFLQPMIMTSDCDYDGTAIEDNNSSRRRGSDMGVDRGHKSSSTSSSPLELW